MDFNELKEYRKRKEKKVYFANKGWQIFLNLHPFHLVQTSVKLIPKKVFFLNPNGDVA